jgi:hypothetical protein
MTRNRVPATAGDPSKNNRHGECQVVCGVACGAAVGASTDEFVLVMVDLHQWNRVDVDREAGR